MALPDPNAPGRFLPAKQDFTYGDRMELLPKTAGPNEGRPVPLAPAGPSPLTDLYDQYKRPPSPKLELPDDSFFYVSVTGQIEFGDFATVEALAIKYDFVPGVGWELIHVRDHPGHAFRGSTNKLVWNFPFEIGYRSTNPKGWPILVVSTIGPDILGRDVIRGYGNVHVPVTPGTHARHLHLFHPISSSIMLSFIGICKGKRPELIDPAATLGKGQGRDVTRVRSEGVVKVAFTVSQLNMQKFGYSVR